MHVVRGTVAVPQSSLKHIPTDMHVVKRNDDSSPECRCTTVVQGWRQSCVEAASQVCQGTVRHHQWPCVATICCVLKSHWVPVCGLSATSYIDLKDASHSGVKLCKLVVLLSCRRRIVLSQKEDSHEHMYRWLWSVLCWFHHWWSHTTPPSGSISHHLPGFHPSHQWKGQSETLLQYS